MSLLHTQTRIADVLNPQCPSRATLEVLADKWAMLILYTLLEKSLRNAQLKRAVGNISQKVLTQTLRKLEFNGLVERTIYNEMPPRVEYSLTELGHTLKEPIWVLAKWAEAHYEDVLAAQARAETEGDAYENPAPDCHAEVPSQHD